MLNYLKNSKGVASPLVIVLMIAAAILFIMVFTSTASFEREPFVSLFSRKPSQARPSKGQGWGNKAAITLDQTNPHFGSWITFTVSTDLANDWVNVRCYQSDRLVYQQYQEVFDNAAGSFTLGPTPSWTGGSASCTADLEKFGNNHSQVIATTTFETLP